MENTDNKILTERAEVILENYFQQIEQGHIPDFQSLMEEFNTLVSLDPVPAFKIACLSSLLINLYPEHFRQALHRKMQKMLRPLKAAPCATA